MKKILSLAVMLAAVGTLLVTSANDAEAAFALRLTEGATTVTVFDDGVGDLAAGTPGAILFLGSVGAFTLSSDTGLSDPVLFPPLPHMDLNLSAVSSGAGTLVVELSQTGFSNTGIQSFKTHWPPVVPGGATSRLEIFIDLEDNLFGTDDLAAANATKVADLGPVSTPGTFFDVSGSAPTDDLYSVTLRWTIVHSAADAGVATTGNVRFQVPEPGSLALFGLGLLGLGFLARRRTARHLDA